MGKSGRLLTIYKPDLVRAGTFPMTSPRPGDEAGLSPPPSPAWRCHVSSDRSERTNGQGRSDDARTNHLPSLPHSREIVSCKVWLHHVARLSCHAVLQASACRH
jgi:hypothetical protein